MVHVVAWLAVYALVLFGLNWSVLPVRERKWFKVLFLPGTTLGAGIQALSAWLCLGLSFRVAVFEDRKPAFALRSKRAPVLGGGLFLFVSQAILYGLYYLLVTRLGLMDRFEAWGLALPGVQPEEILDGRLDFDAAGYAAGLSAVIRAAAGNPLIALSILYLACGLLSSLRTGLRESLWALVLFSILGMVVYTVNSIGIGYPFLTRGFWVRMFYFPRWWAIFSLFVTVAGLSFLSFFVPRLAALVVEGARELFRKKKTR